MPIFGILRSQRVMIMKKITTNFFAFFFGPLIASNSLLGQEPEIRKAIPLNARAEAISEATASDIRIAPSTSDDPEKIKEAQFAVAEGFYQRKEYEIACVEFQKFLQMSTPGDPHRDQALFHLAEAERSLDKNLEAQATFQQLLKETPSGEIAASASYRVGEYYQKKKNYKKVSKPSLKRLT